LYTGGAKSAGKKRESPKRDLAKGERLLTCIKRSEKQENLVVLDPEREKKNPPREKKRYCYERKQRLRESTREILQE